MKRKLNVVCKRVKLVLAGAALVCLLGACAAGKENDENADYGNIGGAGEDSFVNEADYGNQNLEASDGQAQTSADASGGQAQASADASGGQAQASADASDGQAQVFATGNSEQTQTSADVSSGQAQASTDANSGQAQTSADVSNGQPGASSGESDEMLSLSLRESYKAILLDHGEFISTDLQNRKLSLSTIREAVTDDDSVSVTASKFTLTDLDGDGDAEMVLWLQMNGISDYGFEILRYRDGAVYGYTLPYRAFMDLKTDGTFLCSGGSADSEIGKLRFSGEGYVVDPVDDDMSRQEGKAGVAWYELSVEGVETAFGKV